MPRCTVPEKTLAALAASGQNRGMATTPTIEMVPVRITQPHGDQSTTGAIRVQSWDAATRSRRAFKFSGLCFGAALVSVLIPIAHFVLVPLFLLATPIVFFYIANQSSVILGGDGTCPHCHAALPIARATFTLPTTDLCTACQQPVTIDVV